MSTSPIALEKRRLEKAAQAMDVFCDDLADLCGRPDQDDLTQEIYLAAKRAGKRLDVDGAPGWVQEVKKTLDRLTLKQWTVANIELDRSQPDVVVCLERAEEFFAPYTPEYELVVRLAVCLYDYAFAPVEDPIEFESVCLVPAEEAAVPAVQTRASSTLMLATTLRWGATVLCGIGIAMTQAIWLIPMVMVAWLASWLLIDQRTLDKEALARPELSSAEEARLHGLGD